MDDAATTHVGLTGMTMTLRGEDNLDRQSYVNTGNGGDEAGYIVNTMGTYQQRGGDDRRQYDICGLWMTK